jgi:hypothetical protein
MQRFWQTEGIATDRPCKRQVPECTDSKFDNGFLRNSQAAGDSGIIGIPRCSFHGGLPICPTNRQDVPFFHTFATAEIVDHQAA